MVRDDVFVIRDELVRLWEGEVVAMAKRDSLEEDFVLHANRSGFLVDIDQAAFEIFDAGNPIRSSFFREKKWVSLYLQNKFSFYKTHADACSEMITPNSRNQKLLNSYRTKKLQELIDAWSELCTNPFFEIGDYTKFQSNYEAWLRKRGSECPPEHLLMVACKVIAPDKAKFALRRRNRSEKA